MRMPRDDQVCTSSTEKIDASSRRVSQKCRRFPSVSFLSRESGKVDCTRNVTSADIVFVGFL